MKNEIEKIHKLFDVYNTIHKDDGGRAVAMAMFTGNVYQQYQLPCPDSVVLGGEEKKEYAKPRTQRSCDLNSD